MDWPGAPPALSAGWELVPPLKTLPTCSPRSTNKTFANSSRHVSPSVLVTQDSAKNRPYRARRVMISLQVYAQSGLWKSNAERQIAHRLAKISLLALLCKDGSLLNPA